MEPYHKPYNLYRQPDKDTLAVVRRVLECPMKGCLRSIVEYGSPSHRLPETYHQDGIPAETLTRVRELGRPVVAELCNHHGGEVYRPPQLT